MLRVEEYKRKAICELYNMGYSIQKIVECTGVSRMTVQNILKVEKIEMRPRNNKSNPEKDIMIAYKELKKTLTAVVNDKPIDCNSKQACRCVYRCKNERVNSCDYYFKTGKLRGGSPEECYKYAF